MAGALDLVLTITAADAGSAVVKQFTDWLVKTKGASKELQQQLDLMNRSLNQGVKAFALAKFGYDKLKPGIDAAAELQSAMNQVERNTAGSVKNALELADVLGRVRSTTIGIQAKTGQDASSIVGIQNSLLKAGVPIADVTGPKGAAFAASALSSLADLPSELIGDSLATAGVQFNFSKGQDYTDAADWLARVDDVSATSIPRLISGLQMAGASASAMNVPFKDTITTLGQLSPLGDRAGSSLDGFFRGLKSQKWAFGPDGFIGMPKAIDEMRRRLAALPDEQSKLLALQKTFGDEGGRAALTLLNAKTSFEDIEEAAGQTLDLQKKLEISGKAYKHSVEAAGAALKLAASLTAEPALQPLKGVADVVRGGATATAEFMNENPDAAKAVTGIAGTAIAAAGLVGIYKLIRGGAAGFKALNLAGGVGGLAAGVAKGKALEAATGVQPVYVTNWPGAGTVGAGGLGGAVGGIADAVAGTKVLKGLPATLKLLRTLPALSALSGSLGASAMGAAGAGVLAAGAAGYAVGTGLSWVADKIVSAISGSQTSLGSAIYDLINRTTTEPVPTSASTHAVAASPEMTRYLRGETDMLSMLGLGGMQVDQAREAIRAGAGQTDVSGLIRIELEDGRARVRQVSKSDSGVNFAVATGGWVQP